MDFEAMIREARDNGISIDDIAKLFSETLNTIQQEENSVINKRKTILNHMRDSFYEKVAKKQLDCADAAALFTLTMADKYPNWTAENINDFYDTIERNAQFTAGMIGKSPREMFEVMLNNSKDILDDALKPVVEKTTEKKSKSDDDKIAEFLKLFD